MTYRNFRIHRFDNRRAASNDIVANSFLLPKRSYSSRMVYAFYPIPRCNVPMLSTMKYSIRSNTGTRMQRIMLLVSNHPNILMAHLLAIARKIPSIEPSKICKWNKLHIVIECRLMPSGANKHNRSITNTYFFWNIIILSSSKSVISICCNIYSCFGLKLRIWANTCECRKSFSL